MASSGWSNQEDDEKFTNATEAMMQLQRDAGAAAREGRAADLARILETGHKLWTTKYNQVIFCAVESGSTEVMDVLLQHGWDIDMPEHWNTPPFLGKIIRDGYRNGKINEELVHWFLDHGANPNARGGISAITPLSEAVRYGSFDLVKLLLDHGGDVTEGDLIWYMSWEKNAYSRPDFLPQMRFLIEKGAPVNESLFERLPNLKDITWFTFTPLTNACSIGDERVVRLLLDSGADPRKSSVVGMMTPFEAAKDNEEIKKLLLERIAMLPKL